jgi:tRNA(Arg) A34 adenosine deaminase TadA
MTVMFLDRLLDVLEHDVVPLTRDGVPKGNKIFGAAILRKADLGLVVAGTNLEAECPLWHGEVATIKKLYEMPGRDRPSPGDCLFLSTHEPCSMCLSAITWGGYDNIYYLFRYEQTRDAFQIPHDLRILKEVFRCEDGDYARENAYWKAHDILTLIEAVAEPERGRLLERVENLSEIYQDLSARYQAVKAEGDIPLA